MTTKGHSSEERKSVREKNELYRILWKGSTEPQPSFMKKLQNARHYQDSYGQGD